MATEQQITDCKAYLRVDVDDDDSLISSLLDAAITYLTTAGIPTVEGNALYDLAVYGLVLHWYDNRGGMVVGTITSDIPVGVYAIIQQLSLGNSPTF